MRRITMLGAKVKKAFSWLLPSLAVLAVTGCASSLNSPDGRTWVVEQQNERDRLESQGFPQHTGGT